MTSEISLSTSTSHPQQEHQQQQVGCIPSSPNSAISDDSFTRQRISPILSPIKVKSCSNNLKSSPSSLSLTTNPLSPIKPLLTSPTSSDKFQSSVSARRDSLNLERCILVHPPPQDNSSLSPTCVSHRQTKKVSFQNNEDKTFSTEIPLTHSSLDLTPTSFSPKSPLPARKSELKHSRSAEALFSKKDQLPEVIKPISRSASATTISTNDTISENESESNRFLSPPSPYHLKRRDSRSFLSPTRSTSCSQLPDVAPCRLVKTFQKVTEHRKNLKTNPTFDNFLFEYEETLGMDETLKSSTVQIMAEFKKKQASSSQKELKSTNRNIGREYAKGMDPKSLLALCDLKRNKMKLDYFLEGLSTDLGGDSSKSKVEKNLNMIKESMDAVMMSKQQLKKKKKTNLKQQ